MQRIDAHQHFWKYHPVKEAWITDDMKVIQKDFLPEDLKPILLQNGIDGCVAVQADQSDEETRYLLELAQKHDFIKGVVGWVDLNAPTLEQKLESYKTETRLKGFRHILQPEADGFMSTPSFIKGVQLLGQMGFCYDLIIGHRQLPEALRLVSKVTETPLVLDHIAKPDIKNGTLEPWKEYMTQLAAFPNVQVKLSGMVTEANWQKWTYQDMKIYIDIILELFGAERVMFGSDWPVCLLASSYQRWVEVLERATDHLNHTEKQAIFGGNAASFYGL